MRYLKLIFLKCILGIWISLQCTYSFGLEVGDHLKLGPINTLNGSVIQASELKGHFVLVEVWASWCPFCKKQNINMQTLFNQTRDSNLKIIALSVDKNPEDAKAYQRTTNFSFPMAMMTLEISNQIGKRRGIPETYLLDPDGKVIQKDFGLMVDADFFDYARFAKK